MRGLWRDRGREAKVTPALLLAMAIASGACSGGGPVRVAGVVTRKHQIAAQRSEGRGQEKPRYFLWVETEDGMVYVEVTRKLFQSVAEGEPVCINCDSTAP